MGSVHQRDGRWLVDYKDGAGRNRQIRTKCRTKLEAKRLLAELEIRAERQRLGLESLPSATTFGALLDGWWKREGSRRKSDSKLALRAALEKHLGELRDEALTPASGPEFADKLDRLLDAREDAGSLAPRSLNHIRAAVHRVFEWARDPKVALWQGENPIQWVKRRAVTERKYYTLHRDEVIPLLAALPVPSLARPWRWVAAVCIYAGLRPGEALLLRRGDVDSERRIITVRHSWTGSTKTGREREVMLVPELWPYFEQAQGAASAVPGDLIFPGEDGEGWGQDVRALLVDHLRRALSAAGIVEGYSHTCRRCKGKANRGGEGQPPAHTWNYADATQRECPACGDRLWIKPIPRPLRFYDLRHTFATLLRKGRADLGGVQRALGHTSPTITARTYDHSGMEDHRADFERILTFGSAPDARSPRAVNHDASRTLGAIGVHPVESGPVVIPSAWRTVRGLPSDASPAVFLRDQGVAGSNPVSPTHRSPWNRRRKPRLRGLRLSGSRPAA